MAAPALRSKVGLALAGGGPVGGIYEVGALTALAESLDGADIGELDFYVGVSSGGFVAAMLANGLRPETMARMLVDHEDDVLDDVFDPEMLLHPAFGEYFKRMRSLPPLLWSSLLHYLSDPWHLGFFESFQRLSQALPAGVFDNGGIDELLRKEFSTAGRSNDFRQLKHKLFLVATDLDSGESVAFGAAGHDDVPISVAVQASAALPGLFPPVKIGGKYYVDGALIKTLHASVALREGADLVICINPLVPFDASLASSHLPRDGSKYRPGHLVDGGLPVVLSQTFRSIIYSRMRTGMERYRHEYKGSDVVLFEPSRDDAEMFFTNVFSYSSRSRLCEHAYQRTRSDLYQRRHELAPILARHGIRLNLPLLRDHRRSLLPQKRSADLKSSVAALDYALHDLECWLAGKA
jgi:NTE family protein